jgi:hypothetical protein
MTNTTHIFPAADAVATTTDVAVTELRLRPGAVVPAGRLRRGLLATAEVLSGQVAFAVDGVDLDAAAGDVVDIDPDRDVALWNTGRDVAHLRVCLSLPAGLPEADVTRVIIAVEALSGLGSVRDVTGRAGDGPTRFVLERELEDLADLVRAPRDDAPALALAA